MSHQWMCAIRFGGTRCTCEFPAESVTRVSLELIAIAFVGAIFMIGVG